MRSDRAKLYRLSALTGLFIAVFVIAIGCVSVAPSPAATTAPTATSVPTATPAPTATPPPTATAVPTSTPAPTATALPTATPTPTATPVPTATAVPNAQPQPTVAATATPAPTAAPVPTATPEPADTPVAETQTECPTPEQQAYINAIEEQFESFTTILGNVAADWLRLNEDFNLIFGEEFQAGGNLSVQQLRDLAVVMRSLPVPESLKNVAEMAAQIATLSEGYAAGLEPLYNLAQGTPGVADLVGLALEASATEIQRISEIALQMQSVRQALCG